MSADLNTSLKPQEGFVPEQRAVLPVAADLATEYASWVGHKVSVRVPGYHGCRQVQGELIGLLKGAGGDIVLKLKCEDQWKSDGKPVSSIHMFSQSKILEISRTA